MTPFVTDVTSDGLISLGFPEPMALNSAKFSNPGKVALPKRRKLSETFMIKNQDGTQS